MQIVPLPRDRLDEFPWQRDDGEITFTFMMVVKQRKLKCIKCMNKGDELHKSPLLYKVLEI